MDESGINEYLQRDCARAPRGEKLYGAVSGLRYERESFVAAKVGAKIIAPFCYQGTCDTELFNTWLQYCLIPILKHGQTVIADNASFHKSQKSKQLIEEAECNLLFLPSYSPDLNPIEIFWANFKTKVKTHLETLDNLAKAIDLSFQEATA